jgi:hypothetical protein
MADDAFDVSTRFFLLSGSGTLHSGQTWSASLHSEVTSTANLLRWEIRDVLPAIGYQETSAGTAVCRRIADLEPTWASVILSAGLEPLRSHIGLSREMARRRKDLDSLEHASQEAWYSTDALLVLLSDWPHSRKSFDDRKLAIAVGSFVISQTVPLDKLGELGLERPLEEWIPACRQLPIKDGRCFCVYFAMKQFGELDTSEPPQRRILHVLACLRAQPRCKVCTVWLMEVVAAVSKEIDATANEWGHYDPFKSGCAKMMGPSGRKRKRINAGFKEAFAVQAFKEKRCHSTDGMLRSVEPTMAGHGLGMDMELAFLHDLQAAAMLTFHDPHVVFACWDAARVGNPAKDLMGIFIEDARSNLVMPCAPAVNIWLNNTLY